jgi:hypothetical protein
MTHNDKVQIGPGGRALARVRRGSVGGRETLGSVVDSGRRRADERTRNFPPCKALKTHKTAKESRFWASPFRRPSRAIVDLLNRSASLAGIAAGGGPDGKTESPGKGAATT